jgi:hypothetical protein
MSKWSSTTAYAALIIAVGGFVLGILALLAKAPLTALGTVATAWLGAYAANEWSYYFRDKEAAEAGKPATSVVVNVPEGATVS